jgi:hypothetical protein
MNAAVLEQLRAALQTAFSPSTLEIIDDSARHRGHAGAREGGHYQVRLVATAFRGRTASSATAWYMRQSRRSWRTACTRSTSSPAPPRKAPDAQPAARAAVKP